MHPKSSIEGTNGTMKSPNRIDIIDAVNSVY